MAFTLDFNEDFDTLAAEGDFLDTYGTGSGHATKWDAYPDNYLTTKGQQAGTGDHYGRDNISVVSGIAGASGSGNALRMRLFVDTDGKRVSAAPEPILSNGAKAQLYGRYEFRFKADTIAGWSAAFLLWPFSEVWPRDGEIDFPEGSLAGTINAYMHRQNATIQSIQVDGDQDGYPTNVTFADWHVAVTEWTPTSLKFYLDGSLIGTSTNRIPNTRMRKVFQTEPTPGGAAPMLTANVYLDYVKISTYSSSAPTVTRRNMATFPRPGRRLSSFFRYGGAGANGYAEGDAVRIDHSQATDSGYIVPVTFGPGTYTASIDAELFGGATNAAWIVKRQSDGALLKETHNDSPNTKKRLSLTFTVTGTQTLEFVMAQGAYTGLSTGSVRFSNVLIESGSSVGTFFDGATPDTASVNYKWTGAEYASASEAAAVSAPPTTPPPTSPGTDPDLEVQLRKVWLGYIRRYIRPDGGVLQREADNKIPSEAPAYAMRIAVQLDDEEIFDRVEGFCRNVLERRNWKPGGPDNWRTGGVNDPRTLAPNLMAWDYRVNPYGSNPANTVNDWNFATDADVDRSVALHQAAAKGWGPDGGQEYKNRALEIDRQLDKYAHNIGADGLGYQTSDEYGQQGPVTQTGRTPGHHTFDAGGEFEVNPSYFDPIHDHLAKDLGNNQNYSKHLAGGYKMLDKATDNTGGLSPNVGLAPDWFSWNTTTLDAYPLSAGTRGWSYSRATFQKYDGFRTWHRLRWVVDAYGDPEAKALLARFADFCADEWTADGKIAAEHELNGTKLSGGYDHAMFTAGAYLALSADPTNTAHMAIAADIEAEELNPDELFATDAEGYHYWASDKGFNGPNNWSYFGDSWLMFYFLFKAGLWNNFGQTTNPNDTVALRAIEAPSTAVDYSNLSTELGFRAHEAPSTAVEFSKLSVAIRLKSIEGQSSGVDESRLTVAGQPDGPPPVTPPVVDVRRARFIWHSRTKSLSLELTGFVDDVAFTRGAAGLIGGPPVRSRRDYVYGLPGAISRQVVHDVKHVNLPLVGITGGADQMTELVRKMVLMMDPVTNDGVLQYISKDGRSSEISAQVMGGLETDNLGNKGPSLQEFTILLDAVDPYWYSETRTKKFTLAADAPAKWFPILPLRLGSSAVMGEIVLNVESDVDTWPTWSVMGPGSNLYLANVTTEQVLSMDDSAVLSLGQKLEIDTRPRGETARTVRGPGGVNWFDKLVNRSLWPLVRGRNQITIALPGASADSYVALAYRDARLTP